MTLISDITSTGMDRLRQTYQYVFMGIALAMIGSWGMFPYAAEITGWTFWGIVILEFAVLFAFMFTKNLLTYLTFTLLTGITLVPVLAHFIGAGASGAVVQALLGTSVITGGLTFYALTTKKSYLSMGTTLFWILIAVVIMSIANIFIGSSLLATGISIVAVVLFSFFLIYDTQNVIMGNVDPLDAAMNIYLDILNLFTHLLNLIGSGNDD
jgi:modulator of FtsH protease